MTPALKRLRHAIAHLAHLLPDQAPLEDFVHHNTLHGHQHLPFQEALAKTPHHAYPAEEDFRAAHGSGRITDDDLLQVLAQDPTLDAHDILPHVQGRPLQRQDIYLTALLHPIQGVSESRLHWLISEEGILEDPHDRARWQACLARLQLTFTPVHPEELVDLSPGQAKEILAALIRPEEGQESGFRRRMHLEADKQLADMLAQVGAQYTLRGLLLALSGEDILSEMRPLLIRPMADFLDLGVAAWHSPQREKGFYAAWCSSARRDMAWLFENMPDWNDQLAALPEDALAAVARELSTRGLPEERWEGYLERLALEMPGWPGMFSWRQRHPGYQGETAPVALVDFLAVRLVLERLFARRLCLRHWRSEADLESLHHYFHAHKDEFLVRHALFSLELPEYAVQRASQFITMTTEMATDPREWELLALMIWTWLHSPATPPLRGHTPQQEGYCLFLLSKHLEWREDTVRTLSAGAVAGLLDCLARLTPQVRGFIWLQAYENHYRDPLFTAVADNHGRPPPPRAKAQVVFCMDDREEGIRRHLEGSAVETLGAAGFFGVAVNWLALSSTSPVALCPVVVTPVHQVREIPMPQEEERNARRESRRRLRLGVTHFFLNDMRHNPILALAGLPLAALAGLAQLLAPAWCRSLLTRLTTLFEPPPATDLTLTAPEEPPRPDRLGFSDQEQAERVRGLLATIGLTRHFAPLVVIMGHGSGSLNNPHAAAYDCGACSGRHGGPNARIFAAMANRREVRALLEQQEIHIPQETWFLGAEHNTCDEGFLWFDLDKMPAAFAPAQAALAQDLEQAARHSAHERCRKFNPVPTDTRWTRSPDHALPLSLEQALAHVHARGNDISQVQPEFGHATNAAAFIGRRAMSRGLFLDRRVFLISYDPEGDEDGRILENILLNAGPVGAGINLEYYFSTAANDHFGCSSKITHNITGRFGIMDGAESDLRTGLPRQMIEIHEAMRLQVLVEASTAILTAIYQRQPPLQELVGNGWLLLSAKDPASPAIHCFDPARGWLPFRQEGPKTPVVASFRQWYQGHRDHLPPALLRENTP